MRGRQSWSWAYMGRMSSSWYVARVTPGGEQAVKERWCGENHCHSLLKLYHKDLPTCKLFFSFPHPVHDSRASFWRKSLNSFDIGISLTQSAKGLRSQALSKITPSQPSGPCEVFKMRRIRNLPIRKIGWTWDFTGQRH